MNPRRQLLSALFLGAMTLSLLGCGSESPSSITGPDDTSPPQAPANVASRYDEATNRDWLTWDPSASANVVGYEVHYSDSPSGIDINLGSVEASENEYVLPPVAEPTTQWYRLRAIGSNGVPSAFTSPVEVQRAGWTGSQTPTTGSEPTHDSE